MKKPTPERRPLLRNSTGIVILVLCGIALVAIWQYLLEGSLFKDKSPEATVDRFLRQTLADPQDFAIIETFPPREVRSPHHDHTGHVIRVKYRARIDARRQGIFDKGFFVVAGEVQSSNDWTPAFEAQVDKLFEKYGQK